MEFKIGQQFDMKTVRGKTERFEITDITPLTRDGKPYFIHLTKKGEQLAQRPLASRHFENLIGAGVYIPVEAPESTANSLPYFGMLSDGSVHEPASAPQSVTPYEPQPLTDQPPQVGDLIYCDFDHRMMVVREVTDSGVTLEDRRGAYTYSHAWVNLKLKHSTYRYANNEEKIAYLIEEADRLDTLMAELFDKRTAVVNQLNALRAVQDSKQ